MSIKTDPIADMLARINNAIAVNKSRLTLPYSKTKEEVAKTLAKSGFLQDVKTNSSGQFKQLEITINDSSVSAQISSLKRLSRPGQRQYVIASKIPKVRRGRGIVVISTSKGVMTGEEARAMKIGGELICEVF